MYCSNCGKDVGDNSFCPSCGTCMDVNAPSSFAERNRENEITKLKNYMVYIKKRQNEFSAYNDDEIKYSERVNRKFYFRKGIAGILIFQIVLMFGCSNELSTDKIEWIALMVGLLAYSAIPVALILSIKQLRKKDAKFREELDIRKDELEEYCRPMNMLPLVLIIQIMNFWR